jgi:hypothetical protein
MNQQEALAQASLAIRTILSELERTTGMLVEDVHLVKHDVTTIESNTLTLRMDVSISVMRVPAHDWGGWK